MLDVFLYKCVNVFQNLGTLEILPERTNSKQDAQEAFRNRWRHWREGKRS